MYNPATRVEVLADAYFRSYYLNKNAVEASSATFILKIAEQKWFDNIHKICMCMKPRILTPVAQKKGKNRFGNMGDQLKIKWKLVLTSSDKLCKTGQLSIINLSIQKF